MRPLVYVAHPITTYGTDREAAALASLAEMVPHAELFNPAGRYRDAAGWRRSWPRLLPTLAGLVVFGDEVGAVGAGCLKELADAWRLGIPVAMVEGSWCGYLVALRILPEDERSALGTAELIGGSSLILADMIGDPR